MTRGSGRFRAALWLALSWIRIVSAIYRLFVFSPDGGQPQALRQRVDLVVESGCLDLVVSLELGGEKLYYLLGTNQKVDPCIFPIHNYFTLQCETNL